MSRPLAFTASRVAALQQLLAALHTPACQQQVLRQLQTVWPPLLQLLWDPAPGVGAAGAPVVGAIGALAAQATASAGPAAAARGSAGGLLFDWLLPVLARRAAPGGTPLAPGALGAALRALRDCLAGVDPVTLARYANAVLSACQAILEDEALTPEGLPPLLEHSLSARFQDLVDLLLGWALEPALPASTRASLGQTFAAFAPVWQQHAAFARSLLRSLGRDLSKLAEAEPGPAPAATKPGQDDGADGGKKDYEAGAAQLAKLLGLSTCVAAIAGAMPADAQPTVLQQALGSLASRMRRPPPPDAAAVGEMLTVACRLADAAGKCLAAGAGSVGGSASPSPSGAQSRAGPPAMANGQEVAGQMATLCLEGASLSPSPVSPALNSTGAEAVLASPAEQIYDSAAACMEAALSLPAVTARPAALASVLQAQLLWLRFLQQHAPEAAVDRAAVDVMDAGDGALLRLRGHSSTVLLQPLAKLLVFLLQHSPTAMEQVLADAAQLVCSQQWDEQQHGEAASALLFSLRLLHKALPMLPLARAEAVWAALLPLASAPAGLAAGSQPLLLMLVLEAAGSLAFAQHPTMVTDALQLQVAVLQSSAIDESVRLHVLKWLRTTSMSLPQAGGGSAGDSTMAAATARAVAAVAAAVDASSPRVREAALLALASLAASQSGSAALHLEPAAAAELYQQAVSRLADVAAPVAQAAEHLLLAEAGVLALRGSWPGGGGERCPVSPSDVQYALAVQPQQRGFAPDQVQQLLSYLTGAAADEDGTSNVPGESATGGVQQDAAWLLRLLHALPELPAPAAAGGYEGPLVTERDWTTHSLAAWHAVQELAKYCTAARLRTHLGTATQTLAALEQAVQQLARRLPSSAAAAGSAALPPEQARPAHLLLLFMVALEQNVANCMHGSSVRPPPPQSATIFFAANEKVCRGWFARMRAALLRVASALRLPHLAAFHGFCRLQELQQQLQGVLPVANAKPPPQPQLQQHPKLVPVASPAAAPPHQAPAKQLLQRTKGPADSSAAPAASPAAALVAATKASPDAGRARVEPSLLVPPMGGRQQLSKQQLLGAAAKVGEAAGAVAAALCMLHDPASIRGLQSYCRGAFLPLVQQLEQPAPASPGSPGPGEATQPPQGLTAAAASVAATAAWEWLSAAELHAAGKHEQAVWRCISFSSSTSQPFVHASTLAQLTAAAYAAVGDAAGLTAWQKQQASPALRLPPASTACYLDLASWDGMPAGARAEGEAQRELRTAALDTLRMKALDGSTDLERAATTLAELALLQQQQPFPPACLALLPGNGGARRFTCWRQDGELGLGEGMAATQLLPLGLLLKACGSGDGTEHQPTTLPLLLAAASAAGGPGNAACARRLLAVADAAAGGDTAALLRVELGRLQLRVRQGQQGTLLAALWGLLQEAMQCSPTLVPAVASGLARAAATAPGAPVSPKHVAELVESTTLPGNLSTGLAAWELHVTQQLPTAPAVEYAALKAAVAAAPESAHYWWALASWLLDQTTTSSGGAASAAEQQGRAAALAASCKALALGGGAPPGDGSSASATVPLLLQLLRLLTRHSPALPPELLSTSLDLVPATAWLPVVPQLLAQLASSDGDGNGDRAGVAAVQSVLLAIAGAAPAAVLLPGQVALSDWEGGAPPAQQPLAALVHQVQQRQPELASQLRRLAEEMGRLAVLPEEHWHALLQEAAAVTTKRLASLPKGQPQGEAAAAALAPVLLALQQHLVAAAPTHEQAQAAASPHQRHFAAKVLPRLRQLLLQVQQEAVRSGAATSDEAAAAGWQRVAQLLRRGAADMAALLTLRQMAMAEVSPALAAWQGSAVPMPGAPAASGSSAREVSMTVEGVEAEVTVLATKTRPKRLTLLGSDGRSYCFLLKGREDLRADERLMQVLRSADATLLAARAGGARGGGPRAVAVHGFVVTPLAARVGLVQWVESSIPLYEIYTAWHARQAERAALLGAAAGPPPVAAPQPQQPQPALPQQQRQVVRQGSGGKGSRDGRAPHILGPIVTRGSAALAAASATAAAGQAPASGAARARQVQARPQVHGQAQQAQAQLSMPVRPMELFAAQLKASGIDPATPRERWPLARLRQALAALQRGVRRELLELELLAGAASAAHWWQRQRQFAGSLAAMSMVGWLLGLGDRHLDNLLLHRRDGHLVHIDFNVIFDRGEQLKVPEVVPFRLTQVLVAALGPGGVDGAFCGGAAATLRALRANAQPLLALLEAALEDPLVDWNVESAAKQAQRAFEEAIALQLFAVRAGGVTAGLRVAAKAARDSLAACHEVVGAYVALFAEMAAAAATAADSHALQQRCEATLSTAAEQEKQLAKAAADGQQHAAALLAQAAPLAAEAYACLQDCQAHQQRHEAVLAVLATAPPPELSASAALWQHSAAGVPLGLVTSFGGLGSPGNSPGSGGDSPAALASARSSILHAALGMAPSDVPVSSSLLLQASTLDARGFQLLAQRGEACLQLMGLVQQYCAALSFLLGGASYACTSGHAAWHAAFQAATSLPAPQGFQRAGELAPCVPDAATVLPTWAALRAAAGTAAGAAAGLAGQLAEATDALRLERLDLTLAASDSRERLVEAVDGERQLGAIARAFAGFSEEQAGAACGLAADDDSAAALEGLQRLVLGYATAAVAVRDAAPEQLFAAPGGSAGPLDWLSSAVQVVDAIHTLATEVQLLLPGLAALLALPEQRGAVAQAIAAARDAVAAGSLMPPSVEGEEGPLQPLVTLAAQHPALAGLLHTLQQMQMLALQLEPGSQNPDPFDALPQQQAPLVEQLGKLWAELEAAAGWQQCAAALASACGELLQVRILPAIAARMARTASALRAWAPRLDVAATSSSAAGAPVMDTLEGETLPEAGALEPSAGGRPRLVPFSELGPAPASDHSDLQLGELGLLWDPSAAAVGASQGTGPPPLEGLEGLVPFVDFDDGLEGAGELLEQPLGALEDELNSDLLEEEPAAARGLSQGEGEEASLAALLAACCSAAGCLSALDTAAYVAGQALQQCQQQRARHAVELAAFEWVHEELLPADQLEMQLATPVTAATASTAGLAPGALPPATAHWSLAIRRRYLLQGMQAAVNTLLSLEAPLQQWGGAAAAMQQQLSDDLAAAMPYAAPQLHAALGQRQQWLAASAAHAASLCRLGQALLALESSRAALALAPSADPWQRYAVLVAGMRQLAAAHTAAEAGVAAAGVELEQLLSRRTEAESILQSAEVAGKAAAAQFAGQALALVRATQSLAPALRDLLPALGGAEAQAAALGAARALLGSFCLTAKRAAAAFAASEPLHELHARAAEAERQLDAAAELLGGLPPALDALYQALLPVRNRLLGGGRGEAAAREQAADVIDSLAPALTEVQPLAEVLEAVERQLSAMPAELEYLAGSAARQACALQQAGGFSLQGLAPAGGAAAGEGREDERQPGAERGMGALGCGLIPARARPGEQERRAFSQAVVARAAARVEGREAAAGAGVASEEEQVDALVAQAVSPDNLARMYEGWCAWV
eukprot:scaffold1.g5628.t1